MQRFVVALILTLALAACGSGGGGGGGGTGGAGGDGGTGGTGGTGGEGIDETVPPEDLRANPKPEPTPVGATLAQPETQDVGPEGGTLRFFQTGAWRGPTLEFPSGAVSEDTEITVAPVDNRAPHHVGDGWQLGPEGIRFEAPVRLTLPLPGIYTAKGSAAGLGIAYQDEEGLWRAVPGAHVDEAAGTITAEIDHFSRWTAFQMLELRPSQGAVQVGASKGLWIYKCVTSVVEVDDTPIYLLPECNAAAKGLLDWEVNGEAGGGKTQGTVTPVMFGAIYNAPAKKPSSNPVAVSVEVPVAKGKLLLVSNLEVVDDKPCSPEKPCTWVGTSDTVVYLHYEDGPELTYKEHLNIRWKFDRNPWLGRQAIYVPTGTVTYFDQGCSTSEPLVLEAPTSFGTVGADLFSSLIIDYEDPDRPTAGIASHQTFWAGGLVCPDGAVGDASIWLAAGCPLEVSADQSTISCESHYMDEETGLETIERMLFVRE